jgi:hypothetical protein
LRDTQNGELSVEIEVEKTGKQKSSYGAEKLNIPYLCSRLEDGNISPNQFSCKNGKGREEKEPENEKNNQNSELK